LGVSLGLTPTASLSPFVDLLTASFRMGATGPTEYDCWSLTCEVRRRRGLPFPTWDEVATSSMGQEPPIFTRLDKPASWSWVLFRMTPLHVGIMLDPRRFMHITEKLGHGAVESLIRWPWMDRVEGFYEYHVPLHTQPI